MATFDVMGNWEDQLYIPPQLPLPSPPVDAAGGAPGDYGQQVLDLFKFGIGSWNANRAQSNYLDYKKYEASGGTLSQAGVPSSRSVNGSAPGTGGASSNTLLVVGALIVGLLLVKLAK